ncbi:hypothetical protein F5Y06DRAFT_295005 [Hypoxylon sp. FL0890]|nr:hypothetical protein F5Y06DRAFT_295005 [Hypoxylon sp. FL0890]
MAHCSTFRRMSVSSLDDDHFYSAPSSHLASRHTSLVAAQCNPQEKTDHSPLSLEPLVSICQPSHSIPLSPPETQSPVSTRTSKPRWASLQHHDNPKRHHFCPKPLGRRFDRTLHGTSESIPLLQRPTSESNIGTNGYTTSLISSPASPIVTDRWDSMYDNHSPRSERSHSSIDCLPSGNTISIDRHATDAIVRNIRAYLSDKRHNNCPPRTGILKIASENQPPSKLQARRNSVQDNRERVGETTADSYLVSTKDIAGILDIVIAGVRCIHHDNSAARCLSMLLPKEALPKPIPNVKAIIPSSPSIADPATTISSVKPSFSMASFSTYQSHHRGSARTTFISRQSITEVT